MKTAILLCISLLLATEVRANELHGKVVSVSDADSVAYYF